ncbi:hypothetical protein FH972_006004 [Carpinus fangiana]|uniref:Uncharacterized protein n=1 Tax=Carpinus fangiana TaxID=176857 RepID=A0A5N6QTW6_9ROSI|nr:hypothetical protein FH972_006004 [Carpinus fangiana]
MSKFFSNTSNTYNTLRHRPRSPNSTIHPKGQPNTNLVTTSSNFRPRSLKAFKLRGKHTTKPLANNIEQDKPSNTKKEKQLDETTNTRNY